MTDRRIAWLALAAALFAACASRTLDPPARETGPALTDSGRSPLVLLVSFDAFRWDFLERTETPHFDRLAASGVRAARLIPSFPTKTFPNHYTVTTGLYPGHHGVIANNMWDPELQALFTLRLRKEVANGRWYGGEPVWVTAERHGLRTSPYLWPGGEAEIGGIRPTFQDPYDGDTPDRTRIDTVVERLALDPGKRPVFSTVYFSLLDEAAHTFDPDRAPQVAVAIREADDLLGYLVARLAEIGLDREIDLIVVSDHGMAANSPERAILLDDYVDLETANVIDWNPVAAFWPHPSDTERIYAALHEAHPHLQVYRRQEIPERYHYRDHPRTPPILAVADEGWVITSKRALESEPTSFPNGSHGYDNELLSMGALFIASGPSFRSGQVAEPFANIHVYELLCHILGIEPAPNDGDLDTVRHLLRDPSTKTPAPHERRQTESTKGVPL